MASSSQPGVLQTENAAVDQQKQIRSAVMKLYNSLRLPIRDDILQPTLGEEEDDEARKKRRILLLQSKARFFVSAVDSVEESVATPFVTEAEALIEIKRLEEELAEKNELIKDINNKIAKWSMDLMQEDRHD